LKSQFDSLLPPAEAHLAARDGPTKKEKSMKKFSIALAALMAAFGIGYSLSDMNLLTAAPDKKAKVELPSVNAAPLELSAEEVTSVSVYESVNRSVVNINIRSEPDDYMMAQGARQARDRGAYCRSKGTF
jgi:hypothetical protein